MRRLSWSVAASGSPICGAALPAAAVQRSRQLTSFTGSASCASEPCTRAPRATSAALGRRSTHGGQRPSESHRPRLLAEHPVVNVGPKRTLFADRLNDRRDRVGHDAVAPRPVVEHLVLIERNPLAVAVLRPDDYRVAHSTN